MRKVYDGDHFDRVMASLGGVVVSLSGDPDTPRSREAAAQLARIRAEALRPPVRSTRPAFTDQTRDAR